MITVPATKCIGLTSFLLCMPLIFGNILNTARKFKFSHLHPSRDSFTTLTIASLNDCREFCKSVTSCVLVNYHIRGHICKLEHHIGMTRIFITEERRAGYVTWRNELFDTSTGVSNQCPNCDRTQSCHVEEDHYACKTFACGKPHSYGTMNMWGNINTPGGKFIYGCYDHIKGWCYSQYFQCSPEGTWLGLDDVCGYEQYELDGESFKLKIVNKKVNKTVAKERCDYEGAKLTNILTFDKLEFFRRISSTLPGGFWVDLERVENSYTRWMSSDGHIHDINKYLWAQYHAVKWGADCAKSRRADNWRINDIQCGALIYYVCELLKN